MHASDPTSPLYPILSFLAIVVSFIPFSWHFRARNVGTCSYMLSTGLYSLVEFINSIIWADNVNNVAPVWCDICESSLFRYAWNTNQGFLQLHKSLLVQVLGLPRQPSLSADNYTTYLLWMDTRWLHERSVYTNVSPTWYLISEPYHLETTWHHHQRRYCFRNSFACYGFTCVSVECFYFQTEIQNYLYRFCCATPSIRHFWGNWVSTRHIQHRCSLCIVFHVASPHWLLLVCIFR